MKGVGMYDFDTVSLIFGICFGVVPTVIIMTIANMADAKRWKRKDEE